jgi:hypothetical protein
MAFGQNETVVVVKCGFFASYFMWPKNKRATNVRRRAAGGRMPAARRRRRFDGMNAQLVGDALQKFNVRFNHNSCDT